MYGSIQGPTVWAEWSHATRGGVAPEDDPRWLCVFDADLSVLDLRSPEILDGLDVTVDDLNADWAPGAPNSACLKVSAAAAAAGAEGMIVPSAAHPGAWNLDVQSPSPVGRRGWPEYLEAADEDELAALTYLALALQERRHAAKLTEGMQRGRLGYVQGAEEESQRSEWRGLTAKELERVVGRTPSADRDQRL